MDNEDLEEFVQITKNSGYTFLKMKDIEKIVINRAIDKLKSKAKAAKALGIGRSSLYRKIK